MNTILVVCIVVALAFALWQIITHHGCRDIIKMFRSGNVLVAGNKGRGKDMLFSYVIKRREKDGEIHASNIRFTDKTKIRPLTYYSLTNNSRANFIANKFETETHTFIEQEDYYCSDIGTQAPAWAHNDLEKIYPTLPIVFALSRHLGDFRIHANAQVWELIWDKLRKQADYCIYCEKCTILFGKIAIQRVVLYDRRLTAEEYIQPYKVRRGLFGGSKPEDYARAHDFNAKYGFVKRVWFWHIIPKKPYDTRAYYKMLYKKNAPVIEKKHKKKPKK